MTLASRLRMPQSPDDWPLKRQQPKGSNQTMTFRDFQPVPSSRSPDRPLLAGPLRVCTSPEGGPLAALQSVRSHCDCGQYVERPRDPSHDCRDHLGRDLNPMKAARAEGARHDLRRLKNLAGNPPCAFCGDDMPPGVEHDTRSAGAMLPHEESAAQWVRRAAPPPLPLNSAEIQRATT